MDTLELEWNVESEAKAETDDMDWVKPLYSRNKVDEAGSILVAPEISYDEYNDALAVINNWRSAHGRPLYTFRFGLRRHAEKIDDSALVAQRIKRLSSIALKLQRSPRMKLSQMQDIGGCRAVVSSVALARKLGESFSSSDIKHKLLSVDDYISNPKQSGYRSIHFIYKYYSDRKPSHNNLRIEMQVRSQLQHAWATAVESVGTFIQQALKSSQGHADWLRFFALMGSAIAIQENCPAVPGTPTDAASLIKEIKEYARNLDVVSRLQAYGAAVQIVDAPHIENADYFLLELDPKLMKVTVRGYKSKQLAAASDDYLAVEKRVTGTGNDAVLVSADSMTALKRAYPNYFLDTNRFVELVSKVIE